MYHDYAITLIQNEHFRATVNFPPLHSPHEGFAVIEEEFEELKAEVFKNPKTRDVKLLEKEATHVAAMALRFLIDCC